MPTHTKVKPYKIEANYYETSVTSSIYIQYNFVLSVGPVVSLSLSISVCLSAYVPRSVYNMVSKSLCAYPGFHVLEAQRFTAYYQIAQQPAYVLPRINLSIKKGEERTSLLDVSIWLSVRHDPVILKLLVGQL